MDFSLRGDHDGQPPETVNVTVVDDGDPAVVSVAGRLLYDTLGPLAAAIDGLVAKSCTRLVLDLSGAPMCDSSALSLLTGTQRDLAKAGGWVRLAGTQPLVDRVLDITNLHRVLPSFGSVQEALRA